MIVNGAGFGEGFEAETGTGDFDAGGVVEVEGADGEVEAVAAEVA
jgi:hypothetical protein